MDDMIGYIIVFGLIIAGVAIWQFRYEKNKKQLVSQQHYPGIDMKVLVEKARGKTVSVSLRLEQKENTISMPPYIEIIGNGREIEALRPEELWKTESKTAPGGGVTTEFSCSTESLVKVVAPGKGKTFRLVVEDNASRKFKSHEMAFNKRWSLYKPDSGHYN